MSQTTTLTSPRVRLAQVTGLGGASQQLMTADLLLAFFLERNQSMTIGELLANLQHFSDALTRMFGSPPNSITDSTLRRCLLRLVEVGFLETTGGYSALFWLSGNGYRHERERHLLMDFDLSTMTHDDFVTALDAVISNFQALNFDEEGSSRAYALRAAVVDRIVALANLLGNEQSFVLQARIDAIVDEFQKFRMAQNSSLTTSTATTSATTLPSLRDSFIRELEHFKRNGNAIHFVEASKHLALIRQFR